jgi:hypothetical protein
MTVRSSTSAPVTGWDRLQGLLDEFRTEQAQTEHFLAEMLDHVTQTVSNSLGEERDRQALEPDPRVEQVLQALQQDRDALHAAQAAAQTQVEQLADAMRKGLDELLDLSRQRTVAEQELHESILRTIREERSAAARATAEVVDAAVSEAMERVVTRALGEQASVVANSLAEHRAMMAVAAEAMRRAAGGDPEEPNELAASAITPRAGTEASQAAGAVQDSRAAPAGDAVLDSIRAQFELLQRQTARRRLAKPGFHS